MIKHLSVLTLLILTSLFAQTDRETRAVWVASNFRLDWPPPVYNADEQKKALIEIFDNIERKNLNTVYFQVRFNATVLFESSFEPWSYYLTGEVGETPPYDPLDFAIREAHKRGLEIHAWFNMVRCFNGSEQNVFDYPGHVMNRNPEWVRKVESDGQTTYWLDPGIPEVQNYLSNVVIDLAEKYEIDGIQLDFIRYPSRAMDDDTTYNKYRSGREEGQWRRDNITAIVKNISEVVNVIDPDIKLGATPIGVYLNKSGARGLQAYSEIYQESRAWLEQGLLDYLAPQIYWNFEDNPKFNLLVDDWVRESASRNVVIGIASYKPEVEPQTKRMINYTRKAGASGVAFFRYSFIANETYYTDKAFPAAMNWKAPGKPASPENLVASVISDAENKYNLSWSVPSQLPGREEVSYYSIYSINTPGDKLTSTNLYKIIPSGNNSITFTIPDPTRINYYFSVKALDKFWNESRGSANAAAIKIGSLYSMAQNLVVPEETILLKNGGNTYVMLTSENNDVVELGDNSGDTIRKSVKSGYNIIQIDKLDNSRLYLKFENSGKRLNLNQ